MRLAEDGEILLRGPVIFDGYHRDEEATSETFDEEGWFRSGDLGTLDADGFLTISGRKKELIVTGSGKNVYPTPMEETVRADSLVAQAIVVGDGKPFVAALVFPDPDNLAGWAERHGYGSGLSIGEVLEHEEVTRHCVPRFRPAWMRRTTTCHERSRSGSLNWWMPSSRRHRGI